MVASGLISCLQLSYSFRGGFFLHSSTPNHATLYIARVIHVQHGASRDHEKSSLHNRRRAEQSCNVEMAAAYFRPHFTKYYRKQLPSITFIDKPRYHSSIFAVFSTLYTLTLCFILPLSSFHLFSLVPLHNHFIYFRCTVLGDL